MSEGAVRREETVHATCVVVDGAGVLLRGPSGAGKSDLALRLVAEGARLVADDGCRLAAEGGRLTARAPAPIAGRIEARGVGILALPAAAEAPVALVADLRPGAEVERLPAPERVELLGVGLPRVELDPFAASAPAKLRLALGAAGAARVAADERPAGEPAAGGDGAEDAPARAPRARRQSTAAGDGRLRVVLVTGMSGAGRSSALKALEDIGYEAIDNLPLRLLAEAVREADAPGALALGVDTRTRSFAVEPVLEAIDGLLADTRLAVTVLFLDCEDEVLRRRFSETRRRHPLAQGRPLADGLAAERRLVEPLRRRADLVIDTTTMTPADLRAMLAARLGLDSAPGMSVFVTSFSYRGGLPREADLVIDVRFLANPHYEPALRPLDGREARVAAYVEGDPGFAEFLERTTALLRPLLPRYEAEGKSYLTIAVGCTGGRHRSVVVAERLAAWLSGEGREVVLRHRDVDSDAAAGDAPDGDSR